MRENIDAAVLAKQSNQVDGVINPQHSSVAVKHHAGKVAPINNQQVVSLELR
jgi:hypothetical protein